MLLHFLAVGNKQQSTKKREGEAGSGGVREGREMSLGRFVRILEMRSLALVLEGSRRVIRSLPGKKCFESDVTSRMCEKVSGVLACSTGGLPCMFWLGLAETGGTYFDALLIA